MSQPIHHYFINSSHNTYCAYDQLVGCSKVDMYRRCLLDGVRCVERKIFGTSSIFFLCIYHNVFPFHILVDCWNGDDGEPIIYHGHTMTSKIYVEDVCKVIRDYAFVASPYPVILSIENHLNDPQQSRMATIFQEVFGDSIATTPEDPSITFPLDSPEKLKHRILIKVCY
jgi:hypothetical protein